MVNVIYFSVYRINVVISFTCFSFPHLYYCDYLSSECAFYNVIDSKCDIISMFIEFNVVILFTLLFFFVFTLTLLSLLFIWMYCLQYSSWCDIISKHIEFNVEILFTLLFFVSHLHSDFKKGTATGVSVPVFLIYLHHTGA